MHERREGKERERKRERIFPKGKGEGSLHLSKVPFFHSECSHADTWVQLQNISGSAALLMCKNTLTLGRSYQEIQRDTSYSRTAQLISLQDLNSTL